MRMRGLRERRLCDGHGIRFHQRFVRTRDHLQLRHLRSESEPLRIVAVRAEARLEATRFVQVGLSLLKLPLEFGSASVRGSGIRRSVFGEKLHQQ